MNTETIDDQEVLESPPQVVATFALTDDQEAALAAFYRFLVDPIETVFVLSGGSGCGKSTLVKTMLERLDGFYKTAKLINPSYREPGVELTATTNKAAENLQQITGWPVRTIHSFLGLRVQTDWKTNTTSLVAKPQDPIENSLVWIDEFSFVSKELLGLIFTRTKNCKIVFVGDPYQLVDVKATNVPVAEAGFTGAALNQVVRQAEGNPIVELSAKFRETVKTGEFFAFKPDGHHIQHMDREAFKRAIAVEFSRTDWRYQDSKILSWTNKCAIDFNQFVRNLAKGDPHFQEGDYAVCNSFLTVGRQSLKTDQLVLITDIEPDSERHGVLGNKIQMDHMLSAFQPKSLAAKNQRIKEARAAGHLHIVAELETQWVDLRGAYASTVNKAQGSTFGSVFIDLDDIGRCNSGEQIARMLYVGVSRARNHVYLTGDLV